MLKRETFADMKDGKKLSVIKSLSDTSLGWKKHWYKSQFNMKKRIRFYERLAAFIENAVRITDALEIICSRYYVAKDPRAYILGNILYEVQQGIPYYKALEKWIPREETMIISAASNAGKEVEGLREATLLTQSSQQIKNAIYGEIAMPIVLIVMLYLMFVGFRLKMIPIMELILPLDRWKGSSAALYTISSFLTNYWFVFIAVIAVVGVVVNWSITNFTTPIRERLDKMPPWSIYKILASVSFMIGMSSLMRAGLPASQSLKTLNKMANPYVRNYIDKMIKNMTSGDKGMDNIGKAINVGLIEEELAGDMEDMAKLTSFKDALYNSSIRYLKESIDMIKIKVAVFKNILLVTVVLSLMWMVSSFYETIQSIRNATKGL